MSRPTFEGQLRWVRVLVPPVISPDIVNEGRKLQQAVDAGGPYENLHWVDVPTEDEEP